LAILTAVTSVLTGRGVDPATGMTGEITLSGRVLPVGGIREKVLAAYRAGLKRVILPARNRQDLEEVPDDVRGQIEFIPVRSIDELFGLVFDGRSRQSRTGRRVKKEYTKTAKKPANVSRRGAARSPKTAKRGARAAKRASLQAKAATAWNRGL
jgi:predicted ATP-dependent protease